MSAVHDRWELVEPLMLAHPLRDPAAFAAGSVRRQRDEVLKDLRREHRFEEAAIAGAFDLIDDPSPLDVSRPLHDVLRTDADRWLHMNGDHWSLRTSGRRPGYEIVRWRGLTMLLPPSLIIAGALSARGGSSPRRVWALPESVAPSGDVGHLHVHLGPMLPFETMWTQLWSTFLVRPFLDARRATKGLESIPEDAVPLIGRGEDKRYPGLRWRWMLELAFATRVWLRREMDGANGAVVPPVLESFERGRVNPARRTTLLLAMRSSGWFREWTRAEALRLLRARDAAERADLRRLRSRCSDEGVGAVQAQAVAEADDELAFMARSLDHCRDAESRDKHFARLFYQYLRVKVALYSTLVVDPWTTGLRHFLDVVGRDSPYSDIIGSKPALERARLSSTRYEHPLRVRAVEIHIVPGSWIKRDHREDAKRHHAWILSFVRAEKAKKERDDGVEWVRSWGRQAAQMGAYCRQIVRRIEARPALLRQLRGVSLMDWERNGPVWLFEGHLRRLIQGSARTASAWPGSHLRPLRTALHLGEDFDHILSGLRQIYEPFLWGLIARGDRIGHALALGLAPDHWSHRNSWVRVRPWDRVLDIGFIVWACDGAGLKVDAADLQRLRASASDALTRTFDGFDADALDLAQGLWLTLTTTPPRSSRVRQTVLDEARELKRRLLDVPRVGKRGLAPTLSIETAVDLPVIRAVHDFVHKHVAQMHVAVEVNPSSNLLVGGFRSIFEQPIFHAKDIPITLNADDPLTFATTLADDYAYAWAGMVLMQNVTPREATERLEQAAQCSMRYAFHEPPDADGRRGNPR